MSSERRDIGEAIAQGPIVVQTDTVYGLACLPTPEGIEAVFRLKRRPSSVPLPVVIGDPAQLEALGVAANDVSRALAEAFWPGPLTIVFGLDPAQARPAWLGDRIEVGVRLPDDDALRSLALAAGPFLMTSANLHGEEPVRTRAEAEAAFGAAAPIFDADRPPAGATPASSIVNTRVSPPCLERLGAITLAELQAVVPSIGTEMPTGGRS